MPDPQSCIGSLSALRPVHDLIANDVVAQSISRFATEGILHMSSSLLFGDQLDLHKIFVSLYIDVVT